MPSRVDFLLSWEQNAPGQNLSYYELQKQMPNDVWTVLSHVPYPGTEYTDEGIDTKAPSVPGIPQPSIDIDQNKVIFQWEKSNDPINDLISYRIRAVSGSGLESPWSPIEAKRPTSGIYKYEIEIRDFVTKTVLEQTMFEVADLNEPEYSQSIFDQAVEARVRSIDHNGNRSAWSSWSEPVGLPKTPTGLVITEIIVNS